jgi:hypothetical protein
VVAVMCERCRTEPASWHDDYADLAVCNTCCPDRDGTYGMAFVSVLTRADAQRHTNRTNHGPDQTQGGGR